MKKIKTDRRPDGFLAAIALSLAIFAGCSSTPDEIDTVPRQEKLPRFV